MKEKGIEISRNFKTVTNTTWNLILIEDGKVTCHVLICIEVRKRELDR
jgi:hypothetical protein